MTAAVIPVCATQCTHTFPRSPGSESRCAAVPTRPQFTRTPVQQPTKVKAKAKLPTAMTRISHDTGFNRQSRGGTTLSQAQNQVQEAVVSFNSASSYSPASASPESSASIPAPIPRLFKPRKRTELQSAMATTQSQGQDQKEYQHTPTMAAHSFTRTTSPCSSLSLSNSLSISSSPFHNEEQEPGNEENEKKLRKIRRDLHRAEQARLAAVALMMGVRRGEEKARKTAALGGDEVKVTGEMVKGEGERQVKKRRRRERLVDGSGTGYENWKRNGNGEGRRENWNGGNTHSHGHVIDLSTHRPDWTERDECGPQPGDNSGGGGLGARASVVWPIVKKVVSAGLRGRESGDGGETVSLREVVRVRDAGSMVSLDGKGFWGCARFAHR